MDRMKKYLKYWRLGKSKVLHKEAVIRKCHYVSAHSMEVNTENTDTKKRGDRVCDECQRLAKLKK
jgi:hypothetical protein